MEERLDKSVVNEALSRHSAAMHEKATDRSTYTMADLQLEICPSAEDINLRLRPQRNRCRHFITTACVCVAQPTHDCFLLAKLPLLSSTRQ